MENGKLKIENGKWKIENGELRFEILPLLDVPKSLHFAQVTL